MTGQRKRYVRETHCLECGLELPRRKSRFCSDKHAQAYWNARRRKGYERHRLSEVDEQARTATCSLCGPGAPILSAGTRRRVDGSRMWKCRIKEQRWVSSSREHGWRRRGINLTVAGHAELMAAQHGRCAICLDLFDVERRSHVDHCHATGAVRGLLCSSCNNGLGRFDDDPQRLQRAAAYLSG